MSRSLVEVMLIISEMNKLFETTMAEKEEEEEEERPQYRFAETKQLLPRVGNYYLLATRYTVAPLVNRCLHRSEFERAKSRERYVGVIKAFSTVWRRLGMKG